MPDARLTRVFILDDHPIVREGVAQLIERESDMTVCGQASDGQTALDEIASLAPDVAVIDLTLEGMNGLQVIKRVTQQHKNARVLVLSMHDEQVYAARALRAGAMGYVMKQEATKRVVSAIREIMDGHVSLSEAAVERLRNSPSGHPHLTPVTPIDTLSNRELEVFQLIGQGFKTGQIGEQLHVSGKTIETHREHIKEKLNLADGTELVQHAIEWVHGERVE